MDTLISCIAIPLGVVLAIALNLFYMAVILTPIAFVIFGLLKLVNFLF